VNLPSRMREARNLAGFHILGGYRLVQSLVEAQFVDLLLVGPAPPSCLRSLTVGGSLSGKFTRAATLAHTISHLNAWDTDSSYLLGEAQVSGETESQGQAGWRFRKPGVASRYRLSEPNSLGGCRAVPPRSYGLCRAATHGQTHGGCWGCPAIPIPVSIPLAGMGTAEE
jgi:hypothetical protein